MFDDGALTDTKMVVLVVEDDPLSAMISMQALSDIYEAHHVHNGLEAIAFCQESPPDLVLMDINMPNMSGLEASYNLKSDIKTKDIPVFFITGQTDPELENECWDAGCVDFIAKPFSIQTLRHRVISFLSIKSSTDKLKKLSISDTLTSIPNKRFFDGFFFQQARLAARHNSSLGILKCDVDYFKIFNKEYGKFAADNCLKKIAQTLASFARRPTDFVARFESDKFVLVIPDSDLAGIEHIALAVMEAIRELSIPHLTSPSEKVTLCIGGTLITDGSLEVARFLQIVDEHLNQAKELGCERYIIA